MGKKYTDDQIRAGKPDPEPRTRVRITVERAKLLEQLDEFAISNERVLRAIVLTSQQGLEYLRAEVAAMPEGETPYERVQRSSKAESLETGEYILRRMMASWGLNEGALN